MASAGGSASVCAAGSIIVLPTVLDLGAVEAGCSLSRPLTLWNRCSVAQSVSITTVAPFTAPATVSLPALGVIDVPVHFAPPTLGARQGMMTMTAPSGSLSILLRGLGAAGADVTDTFPSAAVPRSDTLFVMSDGPGMAATQQALASSVPSLLQYWSSSNVDYRLAVIAGSLDGGGLIQESPTAPVVLTASVPMLQQRVGQKLSLGETGAGTQSCLSRAVEVLSADAGWLRPNAGLGIICVQNTREQAPGDSVAWARLLGTVAGKAPGQLVVSAIGRFTPGCVGPDDVALRSAVTSTFGALESICAPDGGLAPPAFGYRSSFELSRRGPSDGGFDVQVDGMAVPYLDSQNLPIWSFDAARNAFELKPLYVPEPGKTLTVRYRPACTP